jgi:hypothetical protein
MPTAAQLLLRLAELAASRLRRFIVDAQAAARLGDAYGIVLVLCAAALVFYLTGAEAWDHPVRSLVSLLSAAGRAVRGYFGL